MLVSDEAEELVLDNRAAKGAAGDVAVQLRVLLIVRDVIVVLEEERRGIDPVGPAMPVERPVIHVGSGEVLMSMCAPEVEPCCASYMEALTRTSSIVSGAGVGMALPMER